MTSEWKTSPLRDLVGFISKGIAPSYTDEESETTVRVLNQKCNRNFQITYSESRLHDLSRKKVPVERFVRIDDILINSTGAGTAGRIAQICNLPCDTIVDGHMIIIRANNKVSQKYLGYAMKAHQWEVLQLDEGSTGQTELNRERLLDEIMVSYPTSFALQEMIVKTLEGIDRKLLINEKVNDNLQQQAQAIFHEWFLTQVEKAPEDYCIVSLADLMDYAGGSQPPASMFISEPKDGYIRFVQIRYYESDSHLTYIPISPRNKLCDESDIMIARYGAALGRICFGLNGAYNVALAKVFPKQPYFREFLRCYLSSREFYEGINNKGGRSAQAGFNQSDIRSFELYIPREESMFHAFDNIAKPMFEKRLNIIKENSELAKLRDTLLPKLMSGEIDVSDIQL